LSKKFRIIIALIVCLSFLATGWKIHIRAAPAKTAESFIQAVTIGDASTALKFSSGSAAWAAEKVNTQADIVQAQVTIPNIGRNWCQALAFVEISLSDGSYDAGWYELNLVKQKDWKVISLSEASSWVSGFGFTTKKDTQEAKTAFSSYLKELASGRYQEAGKFLCGPARRAHEAGTDTLKAPLFKQVDNITISPLWRKGNQMVCEAKYKIDNRNVSVIVQFLKLQDGWHILKISQK